MDIILLTQKFFEFKPNRNDNFPTRIFLEGISIKFNYVKAEEMQFKGNVYDFSVEYDAID